MAVKPLRATGNADMLYYAVFICVNATTLELSSVPAGGSSLV